MTLKLSSLVRLFRTASLGAFAAVCAASLHAQSPAFTEDFESGSLNKSVWDARTSGAAEISVQQDKVAHGKSALKVHYGKGGARSYGFIVASKLPESVRQHCFGRAYVFISPNMPAGHDVLLNAGTAGYPISNFLEVGVSGGKNVMVSYQQNAADIPRGETLTRGAEYPVGRWFLLEWEFNDHPDTVTVWIDGEKSGEIANFIFKPRAANAGKAKGDAPAAPAAPEPAGIPGTDLVKGFTDFAFGFRAWGAAPKEDFDIFYDDIVIDTKRVGPIK